jgi:YD repeat-containing protein
MNRKLRRRLPLICAVSSVETNDGRLTTITPLSQPAISYSYDNLGRVTGIAQSSLTLGYGYDALSRLTSETQAGRTVSYEYDAAGRRTKMTWPDTNYVNYDYNAAGDLLTIRENGATTGAGVLATFAYDTIGQRATLTRGNGSVTAYGINSGAQLTVLAHDLGGFASDVVDTLTWSPAYQIATRTGSNSLYNDATPAPYAGAYGTANGLNQYPTARGATLTYDTKGNLTLGRGEDLWLRLRQSADHGLGLAGGDAEL